MVDEGRGAWLRQLRRGDELLAAGRLDEARREADALLHAAGASELPEAWLLRGVIAARAGEAEAERWLAEAHRRGASGAALQLGLLRLRADRFAEAVEILAPAADPIARLFAGEALYLQGSLGEAARVLSTELARLAPERRLLPFYERLAQVESLRSRWGPVADALRVVLQLAPDHPTARMSLARALTRWNRPDETIALLGPSPSLEARWTDARAVPLVPRDEDEQRRYRARYEQKLSALAAMPLDGAQAAALLPFTEGAFPIHYACDDDLPLQRLHGSLLHRVVHTALPGLDAPLPPRPRRARLRVGFVSSFFHEHTVSRLFRGWIEQLDRGAFEVGVHPLGPLDAWGRALVACADRSAPLSGDLARDVATLRGEELDAIVYPELGMDVQTLRLAAVRCAPVQAVAWGHPVTTGLPNVDLFLSSDAMEPPDAAAHYTERLVRLPGLSLCLDAPRAPTVRRAELGIPDDRFLIFCTQSVVKLRPRTDRVFAALARRIPRALLVFVGAEGAPGADVLIERLEHAFAAEGLRFADHAALFPSVGHDAFLRLNAVADVFIDGLTWSGGMTTLEAVGCGLLPVCLEGPWMRTRHTAAILRTLGLPELIARDEAGVVDVVTRLAADPAWRADLRDRLRSATPRLWNDPAPVRALEQVLHDAARR